MVDNSRFVFHICTTDDYQKAQEKGFYSHESIDDEGFIHTSRIHQVLKVANTYYRGIPNLVLLWIEIDKLEAPLKNEKIDGDVFPHIYGEINLDAIIKATRLIPDSDGIFRTLVLDDK